MAKPAYTNTFLYLFYQALKVLVRLVFKAFFAKITFINRQQLNIDRPTILVSNHPNTLLDPLNAAAYTNTVVFFLANAGLFKKGFSGWFLDNTYAIPIERPQDVQGRIINNKDSFARCDQFLAKGGCLYIAPQGVSSRARRIERIKSGTARIGFSAEKTHAFDLGLQILPVGLSYSAPGDFRSEVLINVGPPIQIKDFQEDYEQDTFKAAKKLTAHLQERMEELIIDTRNDEEDQMMYQIEEILRHNAPLKFPAHFKRSQGLLRLIQQMDDSVYADLKNAVDQYFNLLKENAMNDYSLHANINKKSSYQLTLLLTWPLYVYGWINNIIPTYIPAWLTKKLKLYIGYDSTVKVLSGMLTFSIFYCLQTLIIHWIFQTPLITLGYFLSLVPSGLFAWWWHHKVKASGQRSKVLKLQNSQSTVYTDLVMKRTQLSDRIEKLSREA